MRRESSARYDGPRNQLGIVMKVLKIIMVMSLWFIGFAVLFGVLRADGKAMVSNSAGFVVILAIAGVLWLVVAGIRKLARR